MPFCAIIIQLNLSTTVKADKPNVYPHTLFLYYIIFYYLISTQTEKLVTTVRLDINLLQLLECLSVCLSVSVVQSYFRCTKYLKKTNILQFNMVHFYVMFIVTKFHTIWYDNLFVSHFYCISSYT